MPSFRRFVTKFAGFHLNASRELPGLGTGDSLLPRLAVLETNNETTKNPVRGNLKREVWNVTTTESPPGECIRGND